MNGLLNGTSNFNCLLRPFFITFDISYIDLKQLLINCFFNQRIAIKIRNHQHTKKLLKNYYKYYKSKLKISKQNDCCKEESVNIIASNFFPLHGRQNV